MATPGEITLSTPRLDAAVAGGFSGDAPPDAGRTRFFDMLPTVGTGNSEPDGTGADETLNPGTADWNVNGSGGAPPAAFAAT
jgi:hypothetical protein